MYCDAPYETALDDGYKPDQRLEVVGVSPLRSAYLPNEPSRHGRPETLLVTPATAVVVHVLLVFSVKFIWIDGWGTATVVTPFVSSTVPVATFVF